MELAYETKESYEAKDVVAHDGQNLLGYILYSRMNEGQYYVPMIETLGPKRQGVATSMMEFLVKDAIENGCHSIDIFYGCDAVRKISDKLVLLYPIKINFVK